MSFPVLATYIHNMDPFAIQLTESFGIRWYGLAYVAGFAAAFLLLRWFVKLKACELEESKVADFMTLVAIFGVMLGGRLGYMLLYDFDQLLSDPKSFFNLLGGGMSSHGGFAGVVIVAWIYSRIKNISWAGLGDNLVTVAPVGIFFGRLANFVNGELYGRQTDSAMAMKFPSELIEVVPTETGFTRLFPTSQLVELGERAKEILPGLSSQIADVSAKAQASGRDPHYAIVQVITEASRKSDEFRVLLGEILTPRHPSQLYEALLEGLLLFGVLLAVRLKWKNLYHGILTGLFFILYAGGRIFVENYREPDSGFIAGMTKGQFYSTFMIAIGIGFLLFGFLRKRQNQIPS